MKKISFWAKRHVWATRLLIIFLIYPLLNLAGWFAGAALDAGGVSMSTSWGYALFVTTLLLLMAYPAGPHRYARRKVTDMLLASVTFGFILFTGNRLAGDADLVPGNGSYAAAVTVHSLENSKPGVRKEKKGLRKLLKQLRAGYAKSSDGGKAVRIILAVLLAIVLVILLGALACGVACNSSEALAYVIFLAGFGGIIFGLVKLIRHINQHARKKQAEKSSLSS